jgi:outer membrane protein
MLSRINRSLGLFAVIVSASAQTPPKLTLQEAVAIAVKNHPQIQGAQYEANFAHEQITINRSAYYPTVNGDITASQGNDLSRIGAGEFSASRLFNRFGQGATLSQLVTDSGRTPNLVASARFQAQAAAHSVEATRYDVVLQVNRA